MCIRDSIRTIALELGLSRSTVKRALDDLCRAGLLQKDPRWRETVSYTHLVWYSKALAAFYAVERQKKKRYAEYRIGKLYAAGLGCEQDYGDAARWFQLSADKGYKYAQYSLAGLFRRGQGVEQDDAVSYTHLEDVALAYLRR